MMRTRLTTILATALISVVALTGCQGDDGPDETSIPSLGSETPSPSPSESETPDALTPPTFTEATSESEALEQASAAYSAFLLAYDTVLSQNGDGADAMAGFAQGSPLEDVQSQISTVQENGLTVEGARTLAETSVAFAAPSVQDNTEYPFGSAGFQACVDVTTRTVLQDGQPIANNADRFLGNVTLRWSPATSTWLVTLDEEIGPC